MNSLLVLYVAATRTRAMMIDEEGPPTLACVPIDAISYFWLLACCFWFLVCCRQQVPTTAMWHTEAHSHTPRALLNCGPKKTQEGIEFDSHQNYV